MGSRKVPYPIYIYTHTLLRLLTLLTLLTYITYSTYNTHTHTHTQTHTHTHTQTHIARRCHTPRTRTKMLAISYLGSSPRFAFSTIH